MEGAKAGRLKEVARKGQGRVVGRDGRMGKDENEI